MTYRVVETTGLVHDGPVGEKLAGSRFILVQGRAYFNIKRTDQFVSDKQDFGIRMKENVALSTVRSLQRLPEKESTSTHHFTCRLDTSQSRSLNRHRIVLFTGHERHEIRVVTSLLHVSTEAPCTKHGSVSNPFSAEPNNTCIQDFRSNAQDASTQLFVTRITSVLFQWLYQKTKTAIRIPTLSLIGFQRTLLTRTLPVIWLDA